MTNQPLDPSKIILSILDSAPLPRKEFELDYMYVLYNALQHINQRPTTYSRTVELWRWLESLE